MSADTRSVFSVVVSKKRKVWSTLLARVAGAERRVFQRRQRYLGLERLAVEAERARAAVGKRRNGRVVGHRVCDVEDGSPVVEVVRLVAGGDPHDVGGPRAERVVHARHARLRIGRGPIERDDRQGAVDGERNQRVVLRPVPNRQIRRRMAARRKVQRAADVPCVQVAVGPERFSSLQRTERRRIGDPQRVVPHERGEFIAEERSVVADARRAVAVGPLETAVQVGRARLHWRRQFDRVG